MWCPGTLRAVLLVLLLGAVLPWPGGTASAQCAAPWLYVGDREQRRPAISKDDPVTVEGRGVVDGCDDGTGQDVLGCTVDEPEAEVPMTDVTLSIRQGDRSWRLGTEDAGRAEDGELGHITWKVRLPEQVEAGRATLVAAEQELPVVVRRSG